MITRHTPVPWSLEVEVYEENLGTICIREINRLLHDSDCEWSEPEDWERDLANAELIVRAVNSHQELIDALRAVLPSDCPDPVKYPATAKAWEAAYAAIAKAEGVRS